MLSEQAGALNGLLTQDGSRLVASRKGLGGGECHSATHHGTCAAIHLACRQDAFRGGTMQGILQPVHGYFI
jgi:hypothetical protein